MDIQDFDPLAYAKLTPVGLDGVDMAYLYLELMRLVWVLALTRIVAICSGLMITGSLQGFRLAHLSCSSPSTYTSESLKSGGICRGMNINI